MKNIGCEKTERPVYERVCQMSPKCADRMGTRREGEKITKSTSSVADGVRLSSTISLQYITNGGCGSTTLVWCIYSGGDGGSTLN